VGGERNRGQWGGLGPRRGLAGRCGRLDNGRAGVVLKWWPCAWEEIGRWAQPSISKPVGGEAGHEEGIPMRLLEAGSSVSGAGQQR
jgi:hypothetical protein